MTNDDHEGEDLSHFRVPAHQFSRCGVAAMGFFVFARADADGVGKTRTVVSFTKEGLA
jgi:hypothetical protein